jgi:hypothetical protein
VKCVSEPDMLSVEAFLLGHCASRQLFPKLIRGRSRAPVLAMNDTKSLDETLELFAAGVDDVVRKPIHVREIFARIQAIRGRAKGVSAGSVIGELRVYAGVEHAVVGFGGKVGFMQAPLVGGFVCQLERIEGGDRPLIGGR